MHEETDAVLARLREARALLSRIADGENGHLLDDPESD